MKPIDIGDIVDVDGVRLSPDGRSVAYVLTTIDVSANTYLGRVWIVATDGSQPPRRLTDGEGDDLPRWSPDGGRLAYVADGTTIRVVSLAGEGGAADVATWDEGIESLEWSPDGTKLAFVARVRTGEADTPEAARPPLRITRLFSREEGAGWTYERAHQVLIVDAAGSSPPVAVTSAPFDVSGLSWAPDGSRIAFSSGRPSDRDPDFTRDLFTVAATGEGGAPTVLTDGVDTLTEPQISPDGRLVAYAWDDAITFPVNVQVGVLDLDSGERQLITTALDSNTYPNHTTRRHAWDGADVLFLAEHAGSIHLHRASVAGDAPPELVVGGARQVICFDARDGLLAFTACDSAHLSEVYVLRPDGTEVRLTSHGEAFAERHPPLVPEHFAVAAADGALIDAWIVRPPDLDERGSYPALLNIHGGPFIQYGHRIFDEFQVQAAAGFVVLYCNPRGSSGYGEAWARAIRGRFAEIDPGTGWAGVDADDLMTVVDEALRRYPFLDGDRLGVLGGSYGGYLTSWLVGHTDRFKAACSERSLNDLVTFDQSSEIAGELGKFIGASHVEDPEEYRRLSPTTYVRDIHTPMLLIHAENDLHCPIAQAEAMFVGLRLLGREVELLRFPGEGHGMTRSGSPAHRIMRFERQLEFFRRHLGGPKRQG